MKCECCSCENEAIAKVTWIGNVQWSGLLCQVHLDEMWSINHGLVTVGKADVIIEKPNAAVV